MLPAMAGVIVDAVTADDTWVGMQVDGVTAEDVTAWADTPAGICIRVTNTPDTIPNGCPRTGINKKPHSVLEWGVLFCRYSQPIQGIRYFACPHCGQNLYCES